MATIYTHAVVGLGLGKVFTGRRLPALFWFLVAFLPVVPDFDAFSTAPYGSLLGHRGFTHSLAFAVALGLVAALATFHHLKMRFWVLLLICFGVTASHGFLDACTDGGFGIPFFWPLSERRYGPWGPIHVQDIGFEFPDPRTSQSVRTELLYAWLPTAVVVGLVLGFRRLRRKRVAA